MRAVLTACALTLLGTTATAGTPGFAGWTIHDPGTGARPTATLEGDAGAFIVVGCSERVGAYFAGVSYPSAMTIDSSLALRTRVDNQPVEPAVWEVLSDHKAVRPNSDAEANRLVRRLSTGQTFVVEAGGLLESFDVRGIGAVRELLDDCRAK